jgi:aspartate beta-hydroxylase
MSTFRPRLQRIYVNMPEPMDNAALQSNLRVAREFARDGQLQIAESSFERIHLARPDCVEAAIALARILQQRGNMQRGEAVLAVALDLNPDHEMLAVELAVARANGDGLGRSIEGLQRFVDRLPGSPLAWLLLGQMQADAGNRQQSLLARFEAVTRAHTAGVWRDPASTPPHLVGLVAAAVTDVHRHRRDVFFGVVEGLRQEHGSVALQRVDRALRVYVRELDVAPSDSMQRPRFLYFPDLPTLPFLDPYLQPWAPRLQAAFGEIRDEAVSLILEHREFEDFVRLKDGDRIDNYLGGLQPAWEAFFFYRHGQRYDENHARCPRTSAVLDSLDLCRIPGQTPEICFSVLQPGTHILPHYGVTNTRTVMHLPLIVPSECALNLVDRGSHHWKEGELVMFDDTFLHEAWNRSNSVRMILLMDCWNPYLTAVEREAVTRIAQTIGALDVGLDVDAWHAQ